MRSWLGAAAALLFFAAPGSAQTGTVVGTVVDAQTATPISEAVITAQSGGASAGSVISDAQGRFRIQLPVGTYAFVSEIIGYTTERLDGVNVLAGQTTELRLEMTSSAVEMAGFEVIIRGGEKASTIANVNSVSVISGPRLQERAVMTPVEHVRALPGVDVSQTGLGQSNVVTRGFNNVFSGALLVLTDNRYASIPSLRFNAHNMISANQFDVERIEILLGPAAALYGPNSASGVMHVITSSPIDRPETKVSVTAGERNVYMGQFRTAYAFSDNFGIKVSGQYFRGTDWRYDDPAEQAARAQNPLLPQQRDFELERLGGEFRMDWRPADDTEIIVNAGANQLGNSIEMTGIGTGQALDWLYTYGQLRIQKDRFFAQGFINQTNSGDTFLFQTGLPIADESRMFVGQLQQGFSLGDRFDVILGADAQRTDARTNGTINGRNEDDDTIDEFGAFIHTETQLSDNLQFVAAFRADDHSRLEDPVFSPRAALLFEPKENQAFRVSYNRAFATPSSLNLFLDIQAGAIPIGPGVGYDIFTRGVPGGSGFTFNEQCAGGLQDYCMVTPFAPQLGRIPANSGLLFNDLIQVVLAQAGAGALFPVLQNPGAQPGDPTIGSVFRTFDQQALTFVEDPDGPLAIDAIRPTIYNNFEVGYKGLVTDKLLLSVDLYSQAITDFVGPLRVETPNIFFDPTTTGAYIAARLGAAGLIGGNPGQVTPAQIAAITEGLARIPVGTVAPDGENSSDILLSYRNFGEVDLWGTDIGLQYMPNSEITLTGTYSFVNRDCFAGIEGASVNESCTGVGNVALNAPQNKGSFGFRYDNRVSGFAFDSKVRWTESFPMNSGVFQGTVDGYAVMDASVSTRLDALSGVTLGVSAQNLFHFGQGVEDFITGRHQEFVGAPFMGRLLMVKMEYAF
jgi:iron complex outermembrane receptor protein